MNQPITIPGYRTLRELGVGGMAVVHLAIQESFDREVALKIMSPMFNVDPSFATRFVREARIISQIHHASIVPVHDVGEFNRHQYLSMEYLPGGDLKHRLQKHGPNPTLALTVCRAISSALELAHRKGFVHRDIKPENILFREDGTPVLTDFGIARAIDSGTSLTHVGTLVGTPAYMSPEQIKGLELDGRSDLYSLGIVLYEMLTGSQPFRADSTLSLALKHISEDLPPLPPGLAQFQSVLDRLTARERENRFSTGADVIEALGRIGADGMPRMPSPAVAPVRNPTPHHTPASEAATQFRPMAAAEPAAQPLIPRSTRMLWIALGTAAISGAVAMTYMNTRPEPEVPAAAPIEAKAPAPADPTAAQMAAAANQPMKVAGDPLPLTPAIAPKNTAAAVPGNVANPGTMAGANVPPPRPEARTAKLPPMDTPRKPVSASARGPMPEAESPIAAPGGARTLQIPLNLADHALWGEERWRDAAEPEKIARFLVDDIRILQLQMYAQDLENGVARLGIRGLITNSSLEERVVTLRIDLVNGTETTLGIPLEIEVDEQEEQDFDKELDMAAANIKESPPTRLRITLSSKVAE